MLNKSPSINHEKKAVYSKNIVLPEKSQTVSGCILITNEMISEVIETTEPFDSISLKYPEYFWFDYSNLFVNPGLIEMNVCLDDSYSTSQDLFLSYSLGTKAAISGGVTLILDSPSLYQHPVQDLSLKIDSIPEESLYTDLGFLKYVTKIEDLKSQNEQFLAYKSYLIPSGLQGHLQPSQLTSVLRNLPKNKPLFIHPELTSERFLYMTSPFRTCSLPDRKVLPENKFFSFAGAFPDGVDESSSDISPVSGSIATPRQVTPISAKNETVKFDERVLEKEITVSNNSHESVILAEILTYSSSGSTSFEDSPIPCISDEKIVSLRLAKSEEVGEKGRVRRPPPILCERIESKPKEDYKIFLAGCPAQWEKNAISAVIKSVKDCPSKVHICNVSSSAAILDIKKIKKDGFDLITCETSTAYLELDETDIKPGDTRSKVNPPIRDKSNKKHLNALLNLQAVDVVSAYHKNYSEQFKVNPEGVFKRAVGGVNSLGYSLQVCFKAFNEEPKVAACLIAKVLTENPAKILSLESKGGIFKGKHADLVVWDPSGFTLGGVDKRSVFYDKKLPGKVVSTFLRGNLVYCNEEVLPSGRKVYCN